ncbi:MAG: ABC transporter substrate-binding protein [Candidatus Tectomicrobia bacterium]|nr:ABC transporter substrate-binding protein [Candidatus Tectomicrobia bacterium]
MQGKVRAWLIALMSVIWLSGLSLAVNGTPTEFIRQTTDNIFRLFEDPSLQGAAQREERLARLRHIGNTVFDWEEIARRALAIHWRERTPQERLEFAELFRDAVLGMYLQRLEAAAQEQLQDIPAVRYVGEQVDGQRAMVMTIIVTRRGREVPMDYRLRHADGQWRVYDIVIMGVSLVNNYRIQFQRIIAQSSYEELVRQLKARQLGAVFESPQTSR